jgi:hypothetical protein
MHSECQIDKEKNNNKSHVYFSLLQPNSTNEIYDYLKTTYNRAAYPKWWETEDDEMLRPAYIQRFTYNAYNYRITRSRLRQLRVHGI